MADASCPRCGNAQVVQRTVYDRFKAWDPAGEVFEVTLQEPVWSCPACRMCWEGPDTFAAKESAYRAALTQRSAQTRRF
jgi:ribosomal protein L37AE/L43A